MRFRWIWIFPLVCVLSACASNGSSRLAGLMTKPESRVAVQPGGAYQTHWQTKDLILNFEYQWEMDRFDITGKVNLQKYLQHFTTLDHLRIRIHFLDTEGVILSTYNIWNAGRGNSMHYHFVNFNFSQQYLPPEGTGMIAFSYTGEASDAGGDGYTRGAGGRGEWSFWWNP